MAVKTFSIKDTNDLNNLKNNMADFEPKLIVFFSSSDYDNLNPSQKFKEAYPNAKVIGCTSHSEYYKNDFSYNTISVMAIDENSVSDVCVQVVENVSDGYDMDEITSKLHSYYGTYNEILQHFDKYVGLVLFESSCKIEEEFMDKLGTSTDIMFVGGTSSTTSNGISKVYADGKTYTNAVVLALLKTVSGYDVLKTQSAVILSDKTYKVTKSDMKNRLLYELDGRDVKEVYAEALGIDKSDIANYFVSNPVGVLANDEIFIRTMNEIQENGGVSLHCAIPENTEIHILKLTDIVKDTEKALNSAITYEPAGVINFNCLYRTFEMLNKKAEKEYCAIFGKYNSIGFSTSGEAFLGHINQTSTILVIK